MGGTQICGYLARREIEAMERVLESETFARSERLRALLRYLCEAVIGGRERSLSEHTIAVEALGKPDTFSPVEIPRSGAGRTNSGRNWSAVTSRSGRGLRLKSGCPKDRTFPGSSARRRYRRWRRPGLPIMIR